MSSLSLFPQLNEAQVDAIIAESLHRGFFEAGPDGALPTDVSDRRVAASELVRQAILCHRVGNHSDGIVALIHIAEVDPTPPSTEGETMATEAEQLQAQPDEMLPKLLATLNNYDQTEEVTRNVNLIRAEMTRRGMSVQDAAPTNGHVEAAPDPTSPANGASTVPVEPATPPTPDPIVEAGIDAERKTLEDQLTFPMMRAHGIDPSEVGTLTDAQLQWVINRPGGAIPPEEAEPVPTPQEEAVPQSDDDVVLTTRMVTDQPTPEPPAPTLADKAQAAQTSAAVARDDLEGQITGPCLKVYGRGRKEVPDIGDNELRFMIEHPDGKVTQEQLDAARALDDREFESPAPELEVAEVPTIADQRRAAKAEPRLEAPLREVEVQAVAVAPDDAFAPKSTTITPELIAQSQISALPVASGRITKKAALSQELPENPAQDIIDREGFPVPPELDGDPPRLPADISKLSDDDLRSFHARAHAVQSRINFIVGLHDGEHRDLIKLRKGREVVVANNLPAKEDGVRAKYTDAQREALVQADPEVIELREQEHQVERVLRQLRTLQDNYGRDVSVCSRAWSMRKEESSAAGGLKT